MARTTINSDSIYEWMTDNVDRFTCIGYWDEELEEYVPMHLDVDRMVDVAYMELGDKVDPEFYREHGKNPLDHTSRIELFCELAQLVGEPC